VSRTSRVQGVSEPSLVVGVAILSACLLVFVLAPLAATLAFPNVGSWGVTLRSGRFAKAALHSLLMTILSTATATLVGFLFAYTITRTATPLRGLFRAVSVLPLFSPPFMVAFGYVMMVGRNGLITHGLLGLRVNVFGWHGLWLAQTISFFPVAAIVMEGALRSLSPNLLHAASNLGASGARQLWTITLPILRPAFAAAGLLVGIQVLADFGNPILIGGNFSVLATEAWLRVEGWADVQGAAVLSAEILLPSLLLFAAQRIWVRGRTVATVTARAGMDTVPRTSAAGRWLLGIVCGIVSALVLLVYVALLLGAFVKGWGFDWTPTLANLGDITVRGAELLHSILYAAGAALGSAVVSLGTAFLVSRKRFRLRSAMDLAALLPAALPGICFGIGYSILFSRPPLDLYGTAAIVVLSLLFWNISVGHQTFVTAFGQISPAFGEAAANLGAGSFRVLREIELPLVSGAFLSAATVSFIRAVTTLSVVVFLANAGNGVATVSIMNLVNDGFYGKAAALTVSLLILSAGALGLGRLAAGRPVDLFQA